MTSFEWTETRVQAAELLAARNLTHQEIADKLQVERKTLWRWRQHSEFAAEVERITEQYRQETRRIGIADKEKRLAALNDRWGRMRVVIEERADDPNCQKAPGGSTGLLVRQIKMIGSGDAAREVEEFTIDIGLLRELREIEKQAAMELGQWQESPPAELNQLEELVRKLQDDTASADASPMGGVPGSEDRS